MEKFYYPGYSVFAIPRSQKPSQPSCLEVWCVCSRLIGEVECSSLHLLNLLLRSKTIAGCRYDKIYQVFLRN